VRAKAVRARDHLSNYYVSAANAERNEVVHLVAALAPVNAVFAINERLELAGSVSNGPAVAGRAYETSVGGQYIAPGVRRGSGRIGSSAIAGVASSVRASTLAASARTICK